MGEARVDCRTMTTTHPCKSRTGDTWAPAGLRSPDPVAVTPRCVARHQRAERLHFSFVTVTTFAVSFIPIIEDASPQKIVPFHGPQSGSLNREHVSGSEAPECARRASSLLRSGDERCDEATMQLLYDGLWLRQLLVTQGEGAVTAGSTTRARP